MDRQRPQRADTPKRPTGGSRASGRLAFVSSPLGAGPQECLEEVTPCRRDLPASYLDAVVHIALHLPSLTEPRPGLCPAKQVLAAQVPRAPSCVCFADNNCYAGQR